jgi:hypothetical protein
VPERPALPIEAESITGSLLAVLKELMAWHDCLPTRNICDIQDDAKRLIAAAEVTRG